MMEPSRQFMLDIVRRLWYRLDREHFDAETEAALNHEELLKIADSKFRVHDLVYLGGPAYFMILQSMAMRVPGGLKPLLAPDMFGAEEIYRHLQGRLWFPYFVARWRRTGSSAT